MSSLKKRGLILTFSRASNQAVMLFSPLLLVRILDVEQYGQYREFMLYALVLNALIGLAASRSLLYFIPLYPERTRRYISQALLFTLSLTTVGCLLVWAAGGLIRANTSYDFVAPLILYLFCFLNLDHLEFYWLAKKNSAAVLYYSTGRLVLRLLVVVVAAWLTRDALSIAYAVTVFEAFRMLFVLFFSWHKKMFTRDITWASCKEQMAYFLPLGGSNILYVINENLSRLFVSSHLGAVALSLYTIGAYAMPFRSVLRSSVGDVVFTDMVEKSQAKDPQDRLRLWQHSTLLLCLLLFPIGTTMIIYSDLIVRTLFTAQYAAAAPLFAIYALALIRESFDLTLPVRSAGKTHYFLLTNLIGLALNAALLIPFYRWFGLTGPAWAYVVTRTINGGLFVWIIMGIYRIRLGDLLPWGSVTRICIGCVVAMPLLFVLNPLGAHELLAGVGGLFLFGVGYLAFIRVFGGQVISDLMIRLLLRPKRRFAKQAMS